MRISDWSSDVCSSDLVYEGVLEAPKGELPDDWEPVELTLFRSTRFGDDVDRPIRKSDGSWTYLGDDLANHFQRSGNANQLIDIWGAKHAGTFKSIQGGAAARTAAGWSADVKLTHEVGGFGEGQPGQVG